MRLSLLGHDGAAAQLKLALAAKVCSNCLLGTIVDCLVLFASNNCVEDVGELNVGAMRIQEMRFATGLQREAGCSV